MEGQEMTKDVEYLRTIRDALVTKRERYVRQIKQIEEQLKALEGIQQTLSDDALDGDVQPQKPRSGRVPILQGVDDYVREKGRSFTPADIKHYLTKRHGRVSYGSIYQTLTRMEHAGKLRKEGNKFEAVEGT
jgi:hypothetical protein